MNQTDLTAIATDFHTKPNVEAVQIIDNTDALRSAQVFLPPDRNYQAAGFVISLRTPELGGGDALFFSVIDCTSRDRADLFAERFKSTLFKTNPDTKVIIRSSGRFVVYGQPPAVEWVAKYYTLR